MPSQHSEPFPSKRPPSFLLPVLRDEIAPRGEREHRRHWPSQPGKDRASEAEPCHSAGRATSSFRTSSPAPSRQKSPPHLRFYFARSWARKHCAASCIPTLRL